MLKHRAEAFEPRQHERALAPTFDVASTHIPGPFDILGHRADDLVVPDPGLERGLGVFGRTCDLPPDSTPDEGSVLQRNPR